METEGDSTDSSPVFPGTPVTGLHLYAVLAAETGPAGPDLRPDEVPLFTLPDQLDQPDGAGQRAVGEPRRGDETDDRGGSPPQVVITQADEQGQKAAVIKPEGDEDAGLLKGAVPEKTISDQADGSDLQSLKSDSVSQTSEAANSGKSDGDLEDDIRSVATSSVTSLFQRLQLDPLERDWLRLAAMGDVAALRQLLVQDSVLASKKTALHWAAKQGRVEMAEMMVRAGVDVNVKSGYTPLHIAALHGHQGIIQLLLRTYNAKANIRDYHGKMPMHYWSGSKDVFKSAGSQSSGGKWTTGRRARSCSHLPALLFGSRTRGLGPLSLEPASTPELTAVRERPPATCSQPDSPS